ncbi:hypothetical protein D5272_14265 [bacterium D16-76]|nr:hypothetical protein [bacterium D16-76]
MEKLVKQYADAGDIVSLKYIFVDALDDDPTFTKYEEDYNYCRAIPDLLEEHVNLTPLTSDPAQWTEEYWVKLKLDLKKNFSDRRMSHMRKVAKVLMAEKVERLLKERQAAVRPAPAAPVQSAQPANAVPKAQPRVSIKTAEEQKAELRAQIDAHNQEVAEKQAAQKHAIEQKRAQFEREGQQEKGGTSSKKLWGVVLGGVTAVALIVLIIMLILRQGNPEM